MICNRQRAECAQKRHSPECGFRSTHLIASSDEYAQNIPRAMRPGWLARAAFICSAICKRLNVVAPGVPSVAPASRRLSAGRLVDTTVGNFVLNEINARGSLWAIAVVEIVMVSPCLIWCPLRPQ